jgi:hypothetical protein
MGVKAPVVTMEGYRAVAPLKHLKELNLGMHAEQGYGVDLDALKTKCLTRLSLQGCMGLKGGEPALLALLERNPRLEFLNASATPLTEKAVPVLRSLKSLQLLGVSGCFMSKEAVKTLRELLKRKGGTFYYDEFYYEY